MGRRVYTKNHVFRIKRKRQFRQRRTTTGSIPVIECLLDNLIRPRQDIWRDRDADLLRRLALQAIVRLAARETFEVARLRFHIQALYVGHFW